MAGFKSERVAGFNLECMAGFIGIRRHKLSVTFHTQYITRNDCVRIATL